MEIPLALSSPHGGRLVYAIPLWFRLVMALLLAVLAASLATGDSGPGVLGWGVLSLVALAALYDEKWVFDATAGRVVHRCGLLFLPRTRVIDFEAIEKFCIVPMVRGTIPGTEDARIENEAALRGGRADDGAPRRSRHKRPFLDLELACTDGTRRLIDHLPARRVAKVRELATRLAVLCGKPLVEG